MVQPFDISAHGQRVLDMAFKIDWWNVFVPTYSILEIFLRGTLTYLSLFIIMRVLLKRQTGALGIADLLVVVLIADAAQNAMGSEYKSVTEGVLLVLTIVGWDYALDWAEYRFSWMRSLTRPDALPLVRNGRILRRNLKWEMMTEEELFAELRKENIDDLGEDAEAFIEGDGTVSVIKRSDRSPGGKGKRSTLP